MSTAMERWLRRIRVSIGGGWSTSVTRSTRTTSAPRPPSNMPQKGAGPSPPIITMRVPASGPLIVVLTLRPPLAGGGGLLGGVGDDLVAVLQLDRRGQVGGVGVHLQRPLGHLHAERRVGRDLARELERPVEQPVVVDELADQPPLGAPPRR